jgi:hypothetical protein
MTLLPAVLQALHWKVNSFNLAGLLLVPVIVFHVVMAYLQPGPPAPVVAKWIWRPHMIFLAAGERAGLYPWYRNLVLWWALVAGIYMVLYALFW